MSAWVIPYVDQDPGFWEEIADRFGPHIREVYFPVPSGVIASGRSRQPEAFMEAFLQRAPLSKSVLVNPIVLARPVEEMGPHIVEILKQLYNDYGVSRVTVTHPALARLIKNTLPAFTVTASVLMGIATPLQALMVQDYVDVIVPDSRIIRDWRSLSQLRQAFSGEIRLIVNESCLPGCPYRSQHFFEMAYGDFFPQSLCQQTLEEHPWLRLTGAWILPQHLGYYAELCDSFKLAGRVTLRDRAKYLNVLNAYINGEPLGPVDIGGGPASMLAQVDISAQWFEYVLHCDKNCHACSVCKDYYKQLLEETGYGKKI